MEYLPLLRAMPRGHIAVVPEVPSVGFAGVNRDVVALVDATVGEDNFLSDDWLASSQRLIDPIHKSAWIGELLSDGRRCFSTVEADQALGGEGEVKEIAERLIDQRNLALLVFDKHSAAEA